MSADRDEGHAWFALLAGIPAIIAWAAYGLCWLLEPRLAADQSPILWAGYAAAGWYAIVASFVCGPIVMAGL